MLIQITPASKRRAAALVDQLNTDTRYVFKNYKSHYKRVRKVNSELNKLESTDTWLTENRFATLSLAISPDLRIPHTTHNMKNINTSPASIKKLLSDIKVRKNTLYYLTKELKKIERFIHAHDRNQNSILELGDFQADMGITGGNRYHPLLYAFLSKNIRKFTTIEARNLDFDIDDLSTLLRQTKRRLDANIKPHQLKTIKE